MNELRDRKIAILATNGFEEVELADPRKALEKAGAEVHLIAPEKSTIRAWDRKDWSKDYKVDVSLDDADSSEYDGLFLPGGVLNPDKLRMNGRAVRFVKEFLHAGKPIAAICHGPQILIETNELKGRRMTSYPSVKTDLKNAGAEWVDEEVVVDRGLTTSRKPDDIPAFSKKIIEEFREGVHSEMTAK
ncbi:MAG: type 1 glutamine amidotransferase domain-containing protein [Balneolaceae bacterium]